MIEENNYTVALNPKRYQRQNRDIPKTKIPQGTEKIDVYKFRDALDYAHTVGLFKVKADLIPELCNPAQNHYVAKATVYFSDGTEFDAIGDANPENVNRAVGKHMPRMAETRAVGRALGKALNLDANFSDEFGGDDTEETPKPAAKTLAKTLAKTAKADFNAPPSNDGMGGYECEDCGTPITGTAKYTAEKLASWSIQSHSKILCWNCKNKK